jgi:hypothetical protein
MATKEATLAGKPTTENLEPCDLVMKGGITSGVVYPAAVLALKDKYRFQSVGGTSAGAIAAAAVAAAEYGRQSGPSEGGDPARMGFDGLEALQDQLVQDGFLLGLFQPSRKLRPLFAFLVGMIGRKLTFPAKLMAVVRVALVRFWVAAMVGGVVGLLLLWGVVEAFSGNWTLNIGQLAIGVLAFGVSAVLAAFARLGIRLRTVFTKHLKDNFYGICTGVSEENPSDDSVLTGWLYQEIQQCAGRGVNDPLTFGNLQSHQINLNMMTTDLTRARPTRLPDDLASFWFCEQELQRLFPIAVVEHLLDDSRAPERIQRDGRTYCRFPEDINELPVIIGTRMSLSFPVLLSGIPLYTASDDRTVLYQHWFSDGGIGSNFPIHFFDTWLPNRPTFGLNLTPAAKPDSVALAGPRRAEISSMAAFLAQVLDTMQNWRDTMQAELPGFSDRIRDIELEGNEGGMNLNMTSGTIEGLIEKGEEAGNYLRDTFSLEQHRFTRFLTFMQMMDLGLRGPQGSGGVIEKFQSFRADLEKGPPEGTLWLKGHGNEWCLNAAKETENLLAATEGWGPAPKVPFSDNDEPTPTPVMRVTPRV